MKTVIWAPYHGGEIFLVNNREKGKGICVEKWAAGGGANCGGGRRIKQ
jgi:hypothetical protein